MTASIKDLWARLDTHGVETTGYIRLRLADVQACPMYAARRIGSGLEALIVEVDKQALPPGAIYPSTRGMVVVAEPIDVGRTGRARLVVALLEARYRDVFVSLGEDISRHLETCTTQDELVRELLSRLGRWQVFLQQFDPEGLSPVARRALFGELVVLRHLIRLELPPARALASWRGPDAASHDFQLSGGSIEVKTTAAVTPTAVRISNARQLDNNSIRALILVVVAMDETDSAGESLPDLVAEIEGALPETVLPSWEDALAAVGYLNAQSERYRLPRYVVRSEDLYQVIEGFPRLLESDLPEGLSGVTYTLSLAAVAEFRCDEASLAALLEGT